MGKGDIMKKTSQQLLPETLSGAKCPICMDYFRNVATPDCCLHCYCFECIRRWSEIRSECPLCMRSFLTIYHSINDDDFEEFVVKKWGLPTWDMMRTILPFLRTRNTVAFRRTLYRTGVWVLGCDDQSSVSAAHLCQDPECKRQLKHWLRRELTVLYGSRHPLIKRVQRHIIKQITQLDMDDVRINNELYPFLMDHTDQFLHELMNFARSKLSMEDYDQEAVYACIVQINTPSSSEHIIPCNVGVAELRELPVEPMVPDTWLKATRQAAWDYESSQTYSSNLIPQSQAEDEGPGSLHTNEDSQQPGNVHVRETGARGHVLSRRKRQTQQQGFKRRLSLSLNTHFYFSSRSSGVSKRHRKRRRWPGASSSRGEQLSHQEVSGRSNQTSSPDSAERASASRDSANIISEQTTSNKRKRRKRRKISDDQYTSHSSCGDSHSQREPHTRSSGSGEEEPRSDPHPIPKPGRKHKNKRHR